MSSNLHRTNWSLFCLLKNVIKITPITSKTLIDANHTHIDKKAKNLFKFKCEILEEIV